MLSSPTRKQDETPPLSAPPEALPDEVRIPWQRTVTLLRTLMDVPLALVMGPTPDGMAPLVVSREEEAGSLEAAEALTRKVMATRTRHEVTGKGGGLAEPVFNPDGSVFGALCVQGPGPFPSQKLLTELRHTLETRLDLMETRRALALEREKAALLTDRLARERTTDALTGLLMRHTFEERFHQEIVRHKRADHPLSIILCDLDRFREFNDHKGRTAGDALLVTLAELFRERLRTHDLVWRWGGDEFLLLLPDTPLMGAVEVVESVRELMAEHTKKETPVTVSAGVTNLAPGEDEDTCLSRCTRLLEAAKEKGRNCVILG